MKKVKSTFFTFHIANFFTLRSSKVLESRRNKKCEEKKVTVEERQKKAGAPPLLRGQAAQKFRGVAPALRHERSCRAFFHGGRNSEREEHHANR